MPLLKTRSSAMYRRTDAKRKEKRFLLTKNEKDFFDHAAVPFHRTHGIIAIHGDMSNILDCAIAIAHLLHLIVQYGEMFDRPAGGSAPNARITLGHPIGDDASHAQDRRSVKIFR